MTCLRYLLLGYLSGSVLYSYYLPLWFKGLDVTAGAADKNPGAFNCIRRAGWGLGLLALTCDLLKGAVPVYLAIRALDPGCWAFALAVAAPVAGHAWPLFRRFQGGKAIAVSFGVVLGLWPVWEPFAALAACYLFFTLVVRLEPHRFRSIVTYLCFALIMLVELGPTPPGLGCVLASAIVIGRHHRPEPEEGRPTARFALRRQE